MTTLGSPDEAPEALTSRILHPDGLRRAGARVQRGNRAGLPAFTGELDSRHDRGIGGSPHYYLTAVRSRRAQDSLNNSAGSETEASLCPSRNQRLLCNGLYLCRNNSWRPLRKVSGLVPSGRCRELVAGGTRKGLPGAIEILRSLRPTAMMMWLPRRFMWPRGERTQDAVTAFAELVGRPPQVLAGVIAAWRPSRLCGVPFAGLRRHHGLMRRRLRPGRGGVVCWSGNCRCGRPGCSTSFADQARADVARLIRAAEYCPQ